MHIVLLAVLAATVSSAGVQPGHRAPARNGLQGSPLLGAFYMDGDYDGRQKLSLAEASKEARAEIERRLAHIKAFKSRLPAVHTDNAVEEELALTRVALERAAVTMLATPGIAVEAARYAARHPVSYEWEGDQSGPMREAQFAHQYVRQHPRSPLRPFLYVLLLHLHRCAFEAASWNGNLEDKRQAAEGYRWAWQRAMRSPDVVIRAVANDIDAEAFLYIGGQGHPRTWDGR